MTRVTLVKHDLKLGRATVRCINYQLLFSLSNTRDKTSKTSLYFLICHAIQYVTCLCTDVTQILFSCFYTYQVTFVAKKK